MNPTMSFSELRRAFDRVIADLEACAPDGLEFTDSGYYYFDIDDALDIYGDIKPSLGDYEEDVLRIKNEEKELENVSYNYIQSLASIVQYMSVQRRKALT